MSKTFWTCENCNEEVESQFEVCWNCQHDRTGVVPPNFSDLEIEDQANKTSLNIVWAEKFCLACQNNLTYVGKGNFHTGPCAGDLVTQLLSDLLEVQMFFCPTCARVEFFMITTD